MWIGQSVNLLQKLWMNFNTHKKKLSRFTNESDWCKKMLYHYSEAIMGAMASQITSPTIVYATVYSSADQRKHQSSSSPVTDEFLAQMASNAEIVSIWWRHHVTKEFSNTSACWIMRFRLYTRIDLKALGTNNIAIWTFVSINNYKQ